jgi:pimeloyl-ACP methyl ester carboxylesterase
MWAVNAGALPVDERGVGPAVVLLHAGVADRAMWAGQLDPIAAAGRRALALDLPGFGEAPPLSGPPFLDVLATMDALAVERATLVGNSFGGFIALCAALTAPERIDGLVLVSAPPPQLEPSARLAAAWAAEQEALERGDIDAAIAGIVDAWTLPDAPDELRRYVANAQRRALSRDDPEVEWADPLEDDPEVVRTLAVPALVVAGQHEFPDFIDGAARYAELLPDAGHAVVVGAGHLAPLETPEAFRLLLLHFLQR